MSVQIFLQGHLLGIEEYLCSGDPAAHAKRVSTWSEELPARFLTERGLSPILLGSSGGGQFLLVLPQEFRDQAEEYFQAAASDIQRETRGQARLIWSITENLGTWKLIRDRLSQELKRKDGAPWPTPDFAPFEPEVEIPAEPEPAVRAVLRGDVDNFSYLLRSAESIETHVSLSVLYKQFFAGELPRLCENSAELLWTGGDDFAVAGEWERLVEIAAELHRLFDRFVAESLKDFPGPEGKTLSMALALPAPGETLGNVFGECGRLLGESKSVTRDGFHLFGRPIDWKEYPDAVAIKDLALRLIREFGCSRQFIDELRGFYSEMQTGRRRVEKSDRPWRLYRRLAVTLDPEDRRARSREFQKVKVALASEIIGKNVGQARLRPSGRVALEWARRLTEE